MKFLLILLALLLEVPSLHAQSDGGLIPPNTVIGNPTGTRGAARPTAMPTGTVTTFSFTPANGFAGSVANATSTPALTLSTSVTGVLKGNGTAISAATAGTDYQAPISLTTSGTSGAASLIGNTLNIPNYGGGVGTAYFPIESYGAVCDGTTNDAAAINAAIAAAQAAGGGIVQFPGGFCVTQSTITVPQIAFGLTKITIQGTGFYSSWLVAKGSFTGSCLLETKGSILVQGMSFNNGGEIGVSAVSINGFCNTATVTNGGVDHAVLDKNLFLGFGAVGNKCVYNGGTGTTATTTVLNSIFNLCGYAYYSDRWNVGAIIQNNHMFNVISGMYFGRGAGGTYGHTEGLQIAYNEVIAGRDPGGTTSLRPLEIDGVCYDCHITGNIFDAEPIGPDTCPTLAKAVRISGSASTSFEQNWLAKGLLAIGTGATGSYGYNNQLRVVNNSFPGCGAFIQNMNGGSIVGNSFFTNGSNLNIQLLSLVDSNYFAVTANTFQNATGLAVGGTIANCSIFGNIVSYTSAYSPCVGGLNVGGGLP